MVWVIFVLKFVFDVIGFIVVDVCVIVVVVLFFFRYFLECVKCE